MVDALWITVLGMGITFAAIVLLWWMMAGLTVIPVKKEDDLDSLELAEVDDKQLKARIAAIAVAIALAEQEQSSARPLPVPPTALVSAWQLSTRSRQLYEKGKRRQAR
jgi:Na+-transporting methylmalonyl-CoA/oxaloacetate decarboxylase gamma subunit